MIPYFYISLLGLAHDKKDPGNESDICPGMYACFKKILYPSYFSLLFDSAFLMSHPDRPSSHPDFVGILLILLQRITNPNQCPIGIRKIPIPICCDLFKWVLMLLIQSWTSNRGNSLENRVLKCDVIKKNFWNYGICQDILKEQCPRGLLAKNEHFGANCLWDHSPVMLRKLHTNPSKFCWVDPKKLEGFVWSFSEYNWPTSQRQFAP